MGAADGHAGAALGCQNIDHINLDHLAFGKVFAGHLLVLGRTALPPLPRSSTMLPRSASTAVTVPVMISCARDCISLHCRLRSPSAQALADHMLCGLGGNAAKLFGLEGGNKALAHFIGLADLLGIFQADLGVGFSTSSTMSCKRLARNAPMLGSISTTTLSSSTS